MRWKNLGKNNGVILCINVYSLGFPSCAKDRSILSLSITHNRFSQLAAWHWCLVSEPVQ